MIPGMNAKQMKKMERQMKKMGMDMKDLKGPSRVRSLSGCGEL